MHGLLQKGLSLPLKWPGGVSCGPVQPGPGLNCLFGFCISRHTFAFGVISFYFFSNIQIHANLGESKYLLLLSGLFYSLQILICLATLFVPG